ncbi:endonuclease/exonuclease/phosphatase family protein [Niabella yanshanensis]|uniref:Endonuclease/exonuclease/phosphatase family protein n=1 Tax=Niabella yanshanensis TaxID=577386 RepID=A0ABZ0WB93_9BACT|nr:endonuclease/exonuclease/phosphatase family protein [Niabella yanshanensis]WQD39838.1 endonuclease/exonuclease/phosphatase family protein [Niabella yanshanensis]
MHSVKYLLFSILLLNGVDLPAQNITVMSYNIHHGADQDEKDQLAAIGAFIKASRADIIGLQEVDSICTRTSGVDQMKELAQLTGMYYAFVRHYAYQGGAYGMGILSRYPIEEVDNKRMSLLKSKTPSTAMISAVIRLPKNKKVRFASAHFALDDSSRMVQAREAVNYLGTDRYPVILTGDLNATPGTPEIQYLESYFTGTDPKQIMTYPAPVATKKIDYILVSKKNLVSVKQHQVPITDLSDHLPVIAAIEIK